MKAILLDLIALFFYTGKPFNVSANNQQYRLIVVKKIEWEEEYYSQLVESKISFDSMLRGKMFPVWMLTKSKVALCKGSVYVITFERA